MARRGVDAGSAVSSSAPQRVFLGRATSTAPAHGWAGEEPAPGAAATHFRGNTGPIWQSTWLQHGKPREHPMPCPGPFSQPDLDPGCSRAGRREHRHRDRGETHPALQTWPVAHPELQEGDTIQPCQPAQGPAAGTQRGILVPVTSLVLLGQLPACGILFQPGTRQSQPQPQVL